MLALISRPNVTEDQLAWLAENTESPHALGRIAGHPKTSTGTLKAIRDRAGQAEWEGWVHIHRFVVILLMTTSGEPPDTPASMARKPTEPRPV